MFENFKRLSRYRKYRNRGMKLNSDIMSKSIDDAVFDRAGAMLGIDDGKGILVFGSEMEAHAMMDFAMCDLRDKGGRTPAQAHMDDPGPADDIERILLEARISSRTSLFRVEAKDPGVGTVDLSDLLHEGGATTITDMGLGRTAVVGHALFARLFTMPELSMTSGIGFPFGENRIPTLVHRYNKMRKDPGRRDPASRYALFFKMHRRYGAPAGYAD